MVWPAAHHDRSTTDSVIRHQAEPAQSGPGRQVPQARQDRRHQSALDDRGAGGDPGDHADDVREAVAAFATCQVYGRQELELVENEESRRKRQGSSVYISGIAVDPTTARPMRSNQSNSSEHLTDDDDDCVIPTCEIISRSSSKDERSNAGNEEKVQLGDL